MTELIKKIELSDNARMVRNATARRWRRDHPENVRRINRDYWENKARSVFKDDYTPPVSPAELSDQARGLRRQYHRNYQTENKERIAVGRAAYWENKAKKNSEGDF